MIAAETIKHVQLLVDGYLRTETDIGAGPVAIECGSALVHIRLLDCDPTMVRVFSAMVKGATESPELHSALNELNAATNFIRFFSRGGAVYAADELLASTLDLAELRHAVELVADVADHYDDQLVERFGGETALSR